jgi:GAF domain-containing protein
VLDRICREASRHFEAPIGLVTLVGREQLRVKASCGIDATEMPREAAFCASTILADDVLVIADMLADRHFRANPWVTGEPHVRFYAGAPLIYRKEIRLGSVCILDRMPRRFTRGDRAELMLLAEEAVARIAMQEMEVLTARAFPGW